MPRPTGESLDDWEKLFHRKQYDNFGFSHYGNVIETPLPNACTGPLERDYSSLHGLSFQDDFGNSYEILLPSAGVDLSDNDFNYLRIGFLFRDENDATYECTNLIEPDRNTVTLKDSGGLEYSLYAKAADAFSRALYTGIRNYINDFEMDMFMTHAFMMGLM